ncbi:conserved membrane protein of unknown function [Nitrospira japonica]|uniref:Transmembrane protein n=1 Tax=Nitrospira japonica TaxID=1325564 RepID=A0A1W1I3E0_9BACT|nr:hypothetical protein [Nitrospira japonica]SLM47485.1 conserved membrane protein of unknown function [Nitrospira japonica]
MHPFWILLVNSLAGSLVVAIGAWLAWDRLSPVGGGIVFAVAAGLLAWRGKTITTIWAWVTLLLGIESFLWPILTMQQLRASTAQPSDEQMGMLLSAALTGILSAAFWLAFSYGLFKRSATPTVESVADTLPPARASSRKKR